MSEKKMVKRSIAIALGIICIVLVVGLVGAFAYYIPKVNNDSNTISSLNSQVNNDTNTINNDTNQISSLVSQVNNLTRAPYEFRMSAGYPSFNITQGGGFTQLIEVITVSGDVQSINPQDVIFSADSGSSGIQYSFDSTSLLYIAGTNTNGPNGFSTLMTLTIPQSTPTNYYAITVTAKIGSVSHSISVLVAVESSTVTVSGTVNPSYSGITPKQIEFLNTAITIPSQLTYYATVTGSGTYSISVPNAQEYAVSVSDGTGTWYLCSSGFWLEVPAGSSSMTRDFTVFGS